MGSLTRKLSRIGLTVLLAATCLSCAPKERMSVERQVIPSPNQQVFAHTLTRAPDGDIYLTGSGNSVGDDAWAARLGSQGSLRWTFSYRPFDKAKDHLALDDNQGGHREREGRFYDAVALADGSTLLCGVKWANGGRTPFLVRLDSTGKLVEDRLLQPSQEGAIAGIRCLKWGDDVAIVGGLGRSGGATGWMLKLDGTGTQLWEKFDDSYGYFDVIEGPGGDIYSISNSSHTQVVRVDIAGNVVARRDLPGEAGFVRRLGPSSTVRVAVSMFPEPQVRFMEFDGDLKRLIHAENAKALDIKKCYELPDHSVIVFGDVRLSNVTASVTRLYNNSSSRSFVLQRPYESPWVDDGVPGDAVGEFVLLGQVAGNSVVSWVSIE